MDLISDHLLHCVSYEYTYGSVMLLSNIAKSPDIKLVELSRNLSIDQLQLVNEQRIEGADIVILSHIGE